MRLGVGALLLARPEAPARVLGVDRVTARRTAWLARLVGGRELALGLGTLDASSRRQSDPATWLIAQAVSGSADAVAYLTAARRGQVRASAAAGLAALSVSGAACASAMARDVLAARRRQPSRS